VFLKASLKHFLSKERQKAKSWKRGGRSRLISLDAVLGENRYRHEPVDRLTPEEIYERRCALTLLEHALGRLRGELVEADRSREFEELKGYLIGEEPRRPYRELAAQLKTSEPALRKSVQRLRQRFHGPRTGEG